jgi:hypothetical protein
MSGFTGARPLGITIIAALAVVAGLLGLLASLVIFGLDGRLAAISGVITLAIALAEIALGLRVLDAAAVVVAYRPGTGDRQSGLGDHPVPLPRG